MLCRDVIVRMIAYISAFCILDGTRLHRNDFIYRKSCKLKIKNIHFHRLVQALRIVIVCRYNGTSFLGVSNSRTDCSDIAEIGANCLSTFEKNGQRRIVFLLESV